MYVRPAAAATAAFLGLTLTVFGATAASAAPGPDWLSNPIVYAHRGLLRTPRRTPSNRSTVR